MPEPALPPDAFRLGALVVVPSLNRLVRGRGTDSVEPRVMQVLAALAETPGEVVTREALLETVWADVVVNDEALTRAVSELRKALGDDAPGAVETIRGRGYRLAVAVEPLSPPASETPPAETTARARLRHRGALAALALGVAAVALGVSLWAARPSGDAVSDASREAGLTPGAELGAPSGEPYGLDSTSQYYVPGLSAWGVYYDSSAGRYFRFRPSPGREGGESAP